MAHSKWQLQPKSSAKKAFALKPGIAEVALGEIRLRRDGDTRPLTASHVVELAESIGTLGLLEPLVVDTAGHLLAGGHRLAALQILAESSQTRANTFMARCGWKQAKDASVPAELVVFNWRLLAASNDPIETRYPKLKIPVQVVDVSGKKGDSLALAVETAENHVRRQYTRDEIVALAKRLKAAGYKTTPGKPIAGEFTVLNALQAAVGKSKRQIQNILSDKATAADHSDWERATAALRRVAARVIKTGEGLPSVRAKAIVAAARQAQKALA